MNSYFIIERKTEGRKWFDIETIAPNYNEPREIADKTDKFISHWAENNPQIRTVAIEIIEII